MGDVWLRQTKAKLDYAARTCTVQKGKRVHTLHMRQEYELPDDQAEPTLAQVLSYASAKRCLQQSGVAYCLMLVRPIEASDMQVPSDVGDTQLPESPNDACHRTPWGQAF
jgi:hypothetical protein